jgi:hypothetical protein
MAVRRRQQHAAARSYRALLLLVLVTLALPAPPPGRPADHGPGAAAPAAAGPQYLPPGPATNARATNARALADPPMPPLDPRYLSATLTWFPSTIDPDSKTRHFVYLLADGSGSAYALCQIPKLRISVPDGLEVFSALPGYTLNDTLSVARGGSVVGMEFRHMNGSDFGGPNGTTPYPRQRLCRWGSAPVLFELPRPAWKAGPPSPAGAVGSGPPRCKVICLVGGLVSGSHSTGDAVPSDAVVCSSDEGATWTDAPPLPTPLTRASATQISDDAILLVGGDRADRSESALIANVSSATCSIVGWEVVAAALPAAGRVDTTLTTFLDGNSSAVWVGAGVTDPIFALPMADLWASGTPTNASTWRLKSRAVPQGSDVVVVEQPPVSIVDFRDTASRPWVPGTGPMATGSSQSIGLLSATSGMHLSGSSLSTGWSSFLQHTSWSSPYLDPSGNAFETPARFRALVGTVDPTHWGVPVVYALEITLGRIWMGSLVPCQAGCQEGTYVSGCRNHSWDPICRPCTRCPPGSTERRACGSGTYLDRVCDDCVVCAADEEEERACNETHQRICRKRDLSAQGRAASLASSLRLQALGPVYAGLAGSTLGLAALLVVWEACARMRRGEGGGRGGKGSSLSSSGASPGARARSRARFFVSSFLVALPRAAFAVWPLASTLVGTGCHAVILGVAYLLPPPLSDAPFVAFAVFFSLAIASNLVALVWVARRSTWLPWPARPVRSAVLASVALLHPRVFLMAAPPAAALPAAQQEGHRGGVAEWHERVEDADDADEAAGGRRVGVGGAGGSGSGGSGGSSGRDTNDAPPPSARFRAVAFHRRGVSAAIICATVLADAPSLLVAVLVIGARGGGGDDGTGEGQSASVPPHVLVAMLACIGVGFANLIATMVALGNRTGKLALAAKLGGGSEAEIKDQGAEEEGGAGEEGAAAVAVAAAPHPMMMQPPPYARRAAQRWAAQAAEVAATAAQAAAPVVRENAVALAAAAALAPAPAAAPAPAPAPAVAAPRQQLLFARIGVQRAAFDAVALDLVERAACADPDVPPPAAGGVGLGVGGANVPASLPSSLGSEAAAARMAAADAWGTPSSSGESSQACEVADE